MEINIDKKFSTIYSILFQHLIFPPSPIQKEQMKNQPWYRHECRKRHQKEQQLTEAITFGQEQDLVNHEISALHDSLFDQQANMTNHEDKAAQQDDMIAHKPDPKCHCFDTTNWVQLATESR